MHRNSFLTIVAVSSAALLSACSSPSPGIGADVTVYSSGLERIEYIDGVGQVDGMWRDGEVVLAGNLTSQELTGIVSAFGIVRVVNLAPERVVERDSEFDEQDLVARLGLEYIWLPPAPGETQTPERADAVGEALIGAGGPILLHSAWFGDAAAVWWALAVRMGAMDPVEAARLYLQMVDGVQVFPVEGYADADLVPVAVAIGASLDLTTTIDTAYELPLRAAKVGMLEEFDNPDGIRGLAIDGRILVGGQPSQEWLEKHAADELSLVFNLRRHDEMDEEVRFNEAEFCAGLGIRYFHVPTGWDDEDYTPDAVDRFAEATQSTNGVALVHCMVGWRASHFWAAYLHRHRDISANDALQRAMVRTGSWPFTPFERMAGVELEWDLLPR